jgi:hypothetical protein
MDQRSIEKHLRRWRRRDKPAGDLPGTPGKGEAPGQHRHSATTGAGLSIESQIRKEWDPARGGGLPVFFSLADEED